MLEYIRIELNKNRIDYKKHSIQAGTRKWRSILFWFHFLKLYLSKNETKYDERLEDFKKFWKSASKAVNIKECSCSCRGFLKNAICLQRLGYSHLKDLNWFGLDPNSRRDRVNLLTTIKGVLKKDQSTKKQHLLSWWMQIEPFLNPYLPYHFLM